MNGGQLFQTLSSMASILGGGAAVGAQGVLVAPVYQIQGSSYGSVGAALKALDGKVTDIDHRVNVNSNLAAGLLRLLSVLPSGINLQYGGCGSCQGCFRCGVV